MLKSKQTGYWTLTILKEKYLCAIKLKEDILGKKKSPLKRFSINFNFLWFYFSFSLSFVYGIFIPQSLVLISLFVRKVFHIKAQIDLCQIIILLQYWQHSFVVKWNQNRQLNAFLDRKEYSVSVLLYIIYIFLFFGSFSYLRNRIWYGWDL